MATYTLTINERSTQGKALLAYLEALKLDVKRVRKANRKKGSFEQSLDDIRHGRVTSYDSVDDFSKLYNLKDGINELKELDLDLARVEKCINSEFIDIGIYSYKEKKGKIVSIIESKLYEEKIKLLLEYKDKLQNDTLLSERCIENIYLWGEHLIFGVAFGVCKASIKDAIDIYEDKRKK